MSEHLFSPISKLSSNHVKNSMFNILFFNPEISKYDVEFDFMHIVKVFQIDTKHTFENHDIMELNEFFRVCSC